MIHRIGCLILIVMLVGCGALPPMRGANFLQSRTVAWDSPGSQQSLSRLRSTGANWVAFVPFLKQSAEGACDIAPSASSGIEPLRRAIADARALGFHVALKPQILVPGSWPGRIASADEAGWSCWFAAYQEALLPYLQLAQETGVEMFVIGTELTVTERRPEWYLLIDFVQIVYAGQISYVFHDAKNVKRFIALNSLDRAGISFYPPIGNDPSMFEQRIGDHRDFLKDQLAELPIPWWIAEVGYPSRSGAGNAPWTWNDRAPQPLEADHDIQAWVLEQWLNKLNGKWSEGIFIWNWMSDPDAGGPKDTDYTPQNKSAERIIACTWKGEACKP